MPRFPAALLRRVQRFLLDLHSAPDKASLRAFIPHGAATLIASDRANFNEFDVDLRLRLVMPVPRPAYWQRLSPVLFEYMHEHPLGDPDRSPAPHRSGTFAELRTRSAWKRSALYHEYYLPAGIREQMFVPLLCRDSRRFSLAFNRNGRGFSGEERALLELISPHIACALHNMEERSARRRALADRAGEHPALPTEEFTARQRDVLRWLCDGKRNHEIARILEISPRTVGKHLERIFVKLGVETRTAAAREALARGLIFP